MITTQDWTTYHFICPSNAPATATKITEQKGAYVSSWKQFTVPSRSNKPRQVAAKPVLDTLADEATRNFMIGLSLNQQNSYVTPNNCRKQIKIQELVN
jgi:hypothetical protein